MAFNVLTGITAFQNVVSTRLSEWTGAFASNVLGQVQSLPHWERAGMDRPTSLTDLAHPKTAVYLFINPNFAHTVCRIIGVDARSVIGRETRSHRLLQRRSSPSVTLTLTDGLHSVPAVRIIRLLQLHPNARLFLARENHAETRLTASIIGILILKVQQGERVTFRAEGDGASEILREIQGYNEMEWFNTDRGRSLVKIRNIEGTGMGPIVRQILEAMAEFGESELAVVYHSRTRRLIVGHILSTHREIAKAAGFDDPDSYHRLSFELNNELLKACFAPSKNDTDKAGQAWLQEWLADLFRGVRI
jgi:phosphotransferase system HPr-like phosphotransfer protein